MNKLTFDPNYNGGLNIHELPYAVNFTNNGFVWLRHLKELPSGTKFNNNGYVGLWNLIELPEGIEFNNKGNLHLNSLKTLPKDIKFNNEGYVSLRKLNYEELSYEQFMYIYPKLRVEIQTELKYLNRKHKLKRILYE